MKTYYEVWDDGTGNRVGRHAAQRPVIQVEIGGHPGAGAVQQLLDVAGGDRRDDPVDRGALTAAGLALVAARHGLPPAVGARRLGLAGDGPGARGARRKLLDHPAHTLGADAAVVRLARALAAGRAPDGLLCWEGAAGAARGRLRPDAAGLACLGGRRHPFFLEYDRGTTSRRARLGKLAAYYAFLETGRYAEEHAAFPTILVVATSPGGEDRFAEAARAAAVGRPVRLPLLLTTEGRLAPGRHNPAGPLGPIWRDAWSTDRRRWPADAMDTHPPPPSDREGPARLFGEPMP